MPKELVCKEQCATRLRIFTWVFGAVWLIDAIFKWLPGFMLQFESYVSDAMKGQPSIIMPWFMFWVKFVSIDPHLLAVVIAILETLIALSLLLGIARKPMYIIGAITSIGIWSVAEGFGGPYGSGATDIGAAVMYAFLFAGLWGLEQLSSPYCRWTLDQVIAKKWPAWKGIGMWTPAASKTETTVHTEMPSHTAG